MTDISFSDPPVSMADMRADLLPWNYLSPAVGEILERSKGGSRILMVLPANGQPAAYAAIAAETLKDPQATAGFIAALDVPQGLNSARLFLGPQTQRPPNDGMNAPTVPIEIIGAPWENLSPRGFDRAVVIIDAGIAFWNARFQDAGGPRFRGMRYLDFDQPVSGFAKGLDESDIAGLCAMADAQGNRAVMTYLGETFAQSVFGPAANPDPDAFWHGTAVADLAAGAAPGEAETVAMFGLELPRAVVADYSGEMLTAMLAAILPAAIAMTAGFAQVPLTIVMPLGFPAGPQDGSHPAVAAIRAGLQSAGRENVKVVLPAGNHLQDRCRGRIAADGGPGLLGWDLPPDDYSTNALDIFGRAGASLRLQVAGPGQGQAVDATLPQPRSYRFVLRAGERIGVLMRFDDHGGRSRSRLALWRTAPDESLRPVTPAGRWALSSDGPDPLDLWLFRDDGDPVADRSRPRRPSRFWSAGYVLRDAIGAAPLTDDPGTAVLRSGTLSVLATADDPAVEVVQADLRLGQGPLAQAGYSGRRADGQRLSLSELVDDGWPGRGVAAAANGGARRVRMSGTSAAAGLRARRILGLGPQPPF